MSTTITIILGLLALSLISQAEADFRTKIAKKLGRRGLGTPLTNSYINYGPSGVGRGGSSSSAAAAASGGYGGSSSAAAAASSAPSAGYAVPAYPVEPVGVPYNTGRFVDNSYENGGNSASRRATHSSSSAENGHEDDNHYLRSTGSAYSNDEDLNQHYQKKKEKVNSTPYAFNSNKKEESFTMNYKNRAAGSETAHTEHDRHHSAYNKNKSNFDEDVEHSVNNGIAGPSTYYSTSAHNGEESDNYYDSDGLNGGYVRPGYYGAGYQRPAPVYPARVAPIPQYPAPRAAYPTSAASAAATSSPGGSAAAAAATGGASPYGRAARPRLYKQYGGVPAVNPVSPVVQSQSSSASALNKSDFYEQDQSNDHTISSSTSTSTNANAPSVALSGAGGDILVGSDNPVSSNNYYENQKSRNFVKSNNQYNEVSAEASPVGAAAKSSNNYYEHDKSDDHTIQTDDATENTTIDGQSKSGNSYYENNSNKDYVKSHATSDESSAYPGSTAKTSSNFYEANKSKNFVKSSSNYNEDTVAAPVPSFSPPTFVQPSFVRPTVPHGNPYIVHGAVPSFNSASASASASSSSAI